MKKNGDMIIAAEREIILALIPLVGEKTAFVVAESISSKLRLEYGGDHHYVRDPNSPHIRNRQIIRDWKKQREEGRENKKALARKYGITQQTVNRVIANYLQRLRPGNTSFGNDSWVL